ncbi:MULTISPECIES: TMEM164-related integral membrane acyltransferase [Streptomyces]|uniref:TMEM164-related integral membrane acyltransferase n=3 Tax=Streptomyces TaxID=1883 RepID=UPI00331AD37A
MSWQPILHRRWLGRATTCSEATAQLRPFSHRGHDHRQLSRRTALPNWDSYLRRLLWNSAFGGAEEVRDVYSAQPEFSAYGPSHWAAIALFVAGSVFLIWAGRRQTEAQARHLSRALGGILAVIYGSAVLYSLSSPTLGGSVPLQLTDLATVSAIYALWSHRHWPFALTYYWGLVLSTQALISPALAGPDFPGYEFLAFWAIHCQWPRSSPRRRPVVLPAGGHGFSPVAASCFSPPAF